MIAFPLPYTALLALALETHQGEAYFWLGDAGFFLPAAPMADAEWWLRLAQQRWPGMHPDLLPFATDGSGNRFCFHLRGDLVPQITGIVYWSYETYRAIPIATDFGGFLDWLLITAHTMARTLDVHPLDQDHLDSVVVPTAKRLRPETLQRLPALLRRSHSTHIQLVSIAPQCPASQLIVADARAEAGDLDDARTRFRRAQLDFPEFTAAYLAELLYLRGALTSDEQFQLCLRMLRLPLAYGGDPEMPSFGEIPEIDPTMLFEQLLLHAELHDAPMPVAVVEMVANDDPDDPLTWLGAAAECANEGELDLAVVFAGNAALYGAATEHGPFAFDLLAEIYETLQWPWQLAAAQGDSVLRAAGPPVRR